MNEFLTQTEIGDLQLMFVSSGGGTVHKPGHWHSFGGAYGNPTHDPLPQITVAQAIERDRKFCHCLRW